MVTDTVLRQVTGGDVVSSGSGQKTLVESIIKTFVTHRKCASEICLRGKMYISFFSSYYKTKIFFLNHRPRRTRGSFEQTLIIFLLLHVEERTHFSCVRFLSINSPSVLPALSSTLTTRHRKVGDMDPNTGKS